jgi:hypothetical protein
VAVEAIEQYLRDAEPEPGQSQLLLRGSPLSIEKFVAHGARTARAYTYDDLPCVGISVELSLSAADTARLLQGRRLSTRRWVARIRVADPVVHGFVLLPTFNAPHSWPLAARDVIANPYYQTGKEV